MKTHILIENEEAYRFCKKKESIFGDIHWHTTSPWLLEKLPRTGESISSLEKDLSMEDHWNLGLINCEFSENIASFLDEECKEAFEGFSIGSILKASFYRVGFALLYKIMVLKNWCDLYGIEGHTLMVAGNPNLTEVRSFDISLQRFDTIYATFLSSSHFSGVELISHHSSSGEKILEKMNNFNLGYSEKIVMLLNMNLSNLSYSLWTACQRAGILKKTNLSFRWKSRFDILFLKDCDLLSETFLTLLRKGVNVINVKNINLWSEEASSHVDIDREKMEKVCREVLNRSFKLFSLPFDNRYTLMTEILSQRIYNSLRYVKKNIDALPREVERFKQNESSSKFAIATNGLTRPNQKLFQQYLVKTNVPIFSFQHGVTPGIYRMSEFTHSKNCYTIGDDHMLCYSDLALDIYLNNRKERKGQSVGAPEINKRIPYYPLQRFLTRRSLKATSNERIVIYLAFLNHNNYINGPCGMSDLAYLQNTKTIVCDVFGKTTDKCLLKLYPANRYLDPDPFEDLISLPSNVKVLQYKEFIYLRSAVDVIVLDSPMSTLGWAWSVNVPIIFIEHPNLPFMPDMRERMDQALIRVDASNKNWGQEVLRLLQLPKEELEQIWKEKEQVRSVLADEHIYGPSGNSGKRAGLYIVEESIQQFSEN